LRTNQEKDYGEFIPTFLTKAEYFRIWSETIRWLEPDGKERAVEYRWWWTVWRLESPD